MRIGQAPRFSAGSTLMEEGRVTLSIVEQPAEALIKKGDPGTEIAATGVENGLLIKAGGSYHFFTSIWTDQEHIGATFGNAHWISPDGIQWTLAKVLHAPGSDRTGEDVRTLFWEPIPVYDPAVERWNLFYMSGRWVGPKASALGEGGSGKWDGRPWRAVSKTSGPEGICGPWEELGEFDFGPYDPWEGRQYPGEWGSTNTWFPFLSGGRWLAMYGSHRGWQVGLAEAESLSGPWSRLSHLNPLALSNGYGDESPRVFRLPSGRFLCLFDTIKDMGHPDPKEASDFHHPMFTHLGIGYSDSPDGVHWSAAKQLALREDPELWCKHMRCPVGFVEEPDGTYTLYYTAMTGGFFKGFEGLGKVRVSVHEEIPPARPVADGDGIATKSLSLRVSRESGLAEVVDLRTGTVYRQKPAFDVQRISALQLTAQDCGWSIQAEFQFDNAPACLRFRLSQESPEIDVTMVEGNLPWPVPFEADGKGFQWVLPSDYGMLLTADDGAVAPAILTVRGSSPSWLGLAHGQSGAGCLMVLDSPASGAARYMFRTKGGYVALAKTCRRHLKDCTGEACPAETARKNPDTAGMRGAPVFRISAGLDEAEGIMQVVDDLHASGVKRAMIETHPPGLLGSKHLELIRHYGYLANAMRPGNYINFGLSHRSQVPVVGIVRGDSQVAAWHPGQANNLDPASWLKKDLINILYGTAPTYVFDVDAYAPLKQDVLTSCDRVCPSYERIFGSALVDHRWLTKDRDVQETEFSNGWTVTVNFGGSSFKDSRGHVIHPMGCHVFNRAM